MSGLYWSSLSDFYSFVLFMLVPPRPAYAALMLAAALYLAIFGPREAEDHTGINACPRFERGARLC